MLKNIIKHFSTPPKLFSSTLSRAGIKFLSISFLNYSNNFFIPSSNSIYS